MPVNIRENEKYQRIVKSLMKKNIRGEKQITGIFSTLAKWRTISREDAQIDLMREFAIWTSPRIQRREIEAQWMKILLQAPKPKYIN